MANKALKPGQNTGTVHLDEGDSKDYDLTPLVTGTKYVVKATPATARLKWKGGSKFAGGEFEATATSMTLSVTEKDENPLDYTLELAEAAKELKLGQKTEVVLASKQAQKFRITGLTAGHEYLVYRFGGRDNSLFVGTDGLRAAHVYSLPATASEMVLDAKNPSSVTVTIRLMVTSAT